MESGWSASAPLAREADVPPMAWVGRDRTVRFRQLIHESRHSRPHRICQRSAAAPASSLLLREILPVGELNRSKAI